MTPVPDPPAGQSFWVFLRCMWVIAREAFLHPRSTSYIDLTTGKVIRRE